MAARSLPKRDDELPALHRGLTEAIAHLADLATTLLGEDSRGRECPSQLEVVEPIVQQPMQLILETKHQVINDRIYTLAHALLPILEHLDLEEGDRDDLRSLGQIRNFFEDEGMFAFAPSGAEARNVQQMSRLQHLLDLLPPATQKLKVSLDDRLTPPTPASTSLEIPADESGTNQRTIALKPPPEIAFQAYRLRIATGHPQKKLAALLSEELKRKVSQGQVSRWLKQTKVWIAAGNVLPDLPSPERNRPKSIDPERIDLGARQDHRAERQRPQRNEGD